MDWNHLAHKWSVAGCYEHENKPAFKFHKRQGILWIGEQQLAS